jgi:hypothetical protein
MLHAWRTLVCAACIAWGVSVTAAVASPVMLSTTPNGGRGGPPAWSMTAAAPHIRPDAISRAVGDDFSPAVGEQQASVESSASTTSVVMPDPASASSTANAPALIPLPAAASTGALALGGLAFVRVCRTLRAAQSAAATARRTGRWRIGC